MANTLERATGTATTTGATIYTVPVANTITIIGLRLSNKTTSPATAYVTINGIYVTGLDTSIPIGSSLDIMAGSKLVAAAGDVVSVVSSVNSAIDVYLSFLKQS